MAEQIVKYKWQWMNRSWLRRPALLIFLPVAFGVYTWTTFWSEAWPAFKTEVKLLW